MADLVYIPPGVTVDENAQPVPNISGNVAIPPSLVALVGPSIGYQTYTEPILLSATTPVTLTQTGIDTTNMTVTAGAHSIHPRRRSALARALRPSCAVSVELTATPPR